MSFCSDARDYGVWGRPVMGLEVGDAFWILFRIGFDGSGRRSVYLVNPIIL